MLPLSSNKSKKGRTDSNAPKFAYLKKTEPKALSQSINKSIS
jgi:hypothetical protein